MSFDNGTTPEPAKVLEWEFARETDALTGYDELVVRAVDVANCDVKSGQVVRAKLGLKDSDWLPQPTRWRGLGIVKSLRPKHGRGQFDMPTLWKTGVNRSRICYK